MNGKILVDTNILVYAYDLDAGKKGTKAREIIDGFWAHGDGMLTTQVLAEFFVTITRKVKHPLTLAEARQLVQDYRAGWVVFATTPDTVLRAIDGMELHQLSFWDAMIWASAVLNNLTTIYSEDMQRPEGAAEISQGPAQRSPRTRPTSKSMRPGRAPDQPPAELQRPSRARPWGDGGVSRGCAALTPG